MVPHHRSAQQLTDHLGTQRAARAQPARVADCAEAPDLTPTWAVNRSQKNTARRTDGSRKSMPSRATKDRRYCNLPQPASGPWIARDLPNFKPGHRRLIDRSWRAILPDPGLAVLQTPSFLSLLSGVQSPAHRQLINLLSALILPALRAPGEHGIANQAGLIHDMDGPTLELRGRSQYRLPSPLSAHRA